MTGCNSSSLAPGAQVWHKFPVSAGTPKFFRSAKGSRVVTEDGRELLDLYCGSGTVILGHGDEAQIAAVRSVLDSGATVSLRHPLEPRLAQRLVDTAPEAQHCGFFKTGSEAVHAAIIACARATGRPDVLTTAYHGWLLPLGYLRPENRSPHERARAGRATGARAGLGVIGLDWQSPTLVDDVREASASAACLLVTPNAVTPGPEIVREVIAVARAAGALIVFDEVKAGFRYAYPNISTVWDIVPDLRIISKALGNGFPLAALLGGELLASEDNFQVFSTYASEMISIAASLACVERLADGAYDIFAKSSAGLYEGLAEIGAPFGVCVEGVPTFFRLVLPDHLHPDALCRALHARGVLYHPLDEVLVSAAHGPTDADLALAAFHGALTEIANR